MSSGSPEIVVELEHMQRLIDRYFDACNAADAEAIAACFLPDAVHYFPPGMYEGPFRGAETIARRWVGAVETFGSVWTVDSFIGDQATGRAVIEWSHFKTFQETLLRGDEWYRFDAESGLVAEIRAYYAAPQPAANGRFELGGFDYEARGYALASPITRER
jgi:hypothetical protein